MIIEDRIYTFEEVDNYLDIQSSEWQVLGDFLSFYNKLSDEDFAKLLIKHYSDFENTFQHRFMLRRFFIRAEPYKDLLMGENELERYKSLPDEIVIYRGMTITEYISKDWGISWTLNKEIAEKFAYEYKTNFDTANVDKIVISKTIKKEDIFALILDREEEEVIYLQKKNDVVTESNYLHYLKLISDLCEPILEVLKGKSIDDIKEDMDIQGFNEDTLDDMRSNISHIDGETETKISPIISEYNGD